MSQFEVSYKRLNAAQKQSVDSIDGPLLVVAGPGTGKTQLLSLRVANILAKTDTLPDNILCLTFTDSAVSEVRSRLKSIIGQEAYNVTISTYHSFGSELIRQYPVYFGDYASLSPASDLTIDSLLRDIQNHLSYSNPYKNELFLSDLKQLIGSFKQALISPDDLRKVIKANQQFIEEASKKTRDLSQELARISKKSVDSFRQLLDIDDSQQKSIELTEPLANYWNSELRSALEDHKVTNKTTALSKWKLRFLEKDADNTFIAAGKLQADKLLHFTQIYETYLKQLDDQGLYDYDDMILKTINALTKFPEFKYSLQEKYLYILLDEYQDTNQAQAKLVSLLTDNPVNEGRPNVMAVGDDDQAIYAFQGAKYSHMLDFYNNYKDVQLITLKENYRSSADIINLSAKIAEQVSSRLTNSLPDINKQFIAARSPSKSEIKRLNFVNQSDQYGWIATSLIERVKKGEDLSEIAVLSTKHQYLESLVPYLQELDIPINYDRRENILEDPIISQLLSVCRLVCSIDSVSTQEVDSLLASVLNYDFWNLPTELIWQISWTSHEKHQPWLKTIIDEPKTKHIGLYLFKLAGSSKELRFDQLLDQVIGLSEVAINDKIVKSYRSPFYEYYAANDSNAETRIAEILSNVVTLREEFTGYKAEHTKPLRLNDFVEFTNQVSLSGLKILNTNHYVESASSINLMTAYRAKGQEFNTVYVLGVIDEVWGNAARSSQSRISIPPNLEYVRYRGSDEDEKIRLFYVAITRAQNNIIMSSYSNGQGTKQTSSLKFLDEQASEDKEYSPFLPGNSQEVVQLKPQNTEVKNLVVNLRAGYQPLSLKTNLANLLKPRLENFQLSPTGLNNFIDIRNAGPVSFYNRYVLRYPSPVTAIVEYGSAVHESLDWLQRRLTISKQLPTEKQLIDEFAKLLKNKRLESIEYKNLLERGRATLANYYTNNKREFSPDNISEFSFKNEAVFVGDAHLNGNVDKLVVNKEAKTLSVIDYKTGKSYSRWSNEPKLHLYANQLYFYKLLINKSGSFKNYELDNAYLDFIEPDANGQLNKLSIDFTDEKMAHFEKLIKVVWQHIHDLNFPDVSRYSTDLKGILQFENDLIDGLI